MIYLFIIIFFNIYLKKCYITNPLIWRGKKDFNKNVKVIFFILDKIKFLRQMQLFFSLNWEKKKKLFFGKSVKTTKSYFLKNVNKIFEKKWKLCFVLFVIEASFLRIWWHWKGPLGWWWPWKGPLDWSISSFSSSRSSKASSSSCSCPP